ncbi:MAG: MBL fold metallo-hydrolase [Thermotogae bacterium]|nr:MBL fold metallo-hydrolase [Thermotogota bacterium]
MLRELGRNVYAITGNKGGANCGFVITNEGVIVIDTTLFPSKAKEILDNIHIITSEPIIYVFNTHYHGEHIFGNEIFNAPVIASAKTLEILHSISDSYVNEYMGKDEDLIPLLKDVHVVLPSITFNRKKTFTFGDKRLIFVHTGGHTPDSSYAFIEPDNIVFSGDLIFAGLHPQICKDSNIENWKRAILNIRKLYPEYIVPGHGNICDVEETDAMLNYFLTLEKIMKEIEQESDIDKISKLKGISEMSNLGFPELFVSNLKVLFYLKYNKKKVVKYT